VAFCPVVSRAENRALILILVLIMLLLPLGFILMERG
jgi:hypothetical protein